MQLTAITCNLRTKKTDCLVLVLTNQKDGVYVPPTNIDDSSGYLGSTIDGLIIKLQKSGDIKTKLGSSILINSPDGLKADRLLIVSSGDKSLNEQMFLALVKTVSERIKDMPIKDVLLTLQELDISDRDKVWQAQKISQVLGEQSYYPGSLKTSAKNPYFLKQLQIH